MLAIISQLFFFLGLVIIILLVARKTPKVVKEIDSKEEPLEIQIENHIGRSFFAIPWDKIDLATERFLEKTMRRLHIWTMKIDAFLQKKLETLKNKNKGKTSFIEEVNGKSLTDKEDVAEVIDLTEIDLDDLEIPLKTKDDLNEQRELKEVVDLTTKKEEDEKESEENKNKRVRKSKN
ncbi:MAG: hypothetical protein WC579_02190 [Candidatus Paceibacterota bacterium]|nr:hypothetical protein [Candidatus Paceibacterota bacterium]HQM34845.1 hypothetical protein [Candidatus Paceibacterota bacterium]